MRHVTTKREREILRLLADNEPDGWCYLAIGFRARVGIILGSPGLQHDRRVGAANWRTIMAMQSAGLVKVGVYVTLPEYDGRVRGEDRAGYALALTDKGREAAAT